MLRRRSSLDHDAVAAARRRLAALGDTARADGLAGCRVEDRSGPTVGGADEASTTPDPRDDPARHRRPGFAVSVGRFAITPAQVAVVALCLVGLMALTCWWVLRSVPSSHDVSMPMSRQLPSARPAARAHASPHVRPASPSPRGVVVVDVGGKVRRPGVVELPAGSRVVDAVDAAGGVRRGVSTRSVNLARVLVDGEQILVGVKRPPLPPTGPVAVPGTPPAAEGTEDAGGLVDLNAADQAELEGLPGVGPVTATAIIDWRTENGGFSSVDELLEVSGIGEVTMAELEPLVTV